MLAYSVPVFATHQLSSVSQNHPLTFIHCRRYRCFPVSTNSRLAYGRLRAEGRDDARNCVNFSTARVQLTSPLFFGPVRSLVPIAPSSSSVLPSSSRSCFLRFCAWKNRLFPTAKPARRRASPTQFFLQPSLSVFFVRRYFEHVDAMVLANDFIISYFFQTRLYPYRFSNFLLSLDTT